MKEMVPEDWLVCPKCGSEDVTIKDLASWSDYRPTVSCEQCGHGGYFD